jgi:hypothetical protein
VARGIAGGQAHQWRALDEQACHRVQAIADLGASEFGGFADERAQLGLGADDFRGERVGVVCGDGHRALVAAWCKAAIVDIGAKVNKRGMKW